MQKALSDFKSKAESAIRVITDGKYDESTFLSSELKPRVEELLGGKDLVEYQRIDDKDYATLVAENFLRSIVIELAQSKVPEGGRAQAKAGRINYSHFPLPTSHFRWGDEFGDWFHNRYGIYKIIVASGKSQRLSPTGLIHKQIMRPDGYNTNIKFTRYASAFGDNPDVIAIDYLVAYHILSDRGVTNATKEKICQSIEAKFSEIAERCGLNTTKFHKLWIEITKIIEGEMMRTNSSGREDVASAIRLVGKFCLEAIPDGIKARHLADEIGCVILKELVEGKDNYIDSTKRDDLLGGNSLIAVANAYGPGEAYIAGLQRIIDLNLADDTRYNIPIYSDYASSFLDSYPNIYFHTYLIALSRFNLNGVGKFMVDRLPAVTIGGKSPLDKVEDRGNAILTDTEYGAVPTAIREWRDMTEEQHEDAQRRLEQSRNTGEPHHALNAGVFVIDTKWAIENISTIRQNFDHPYPERGRLHEFWYTDFVEIVAKESSDEPRTRIVFLGQDAPSGNKDMGRTLEFQSQLHKMLRTKLVECGIFVDEEARVAMGSPNADFDPTGDIRRIFGVDGKIDQIYLLGRIYLDTTVRVGNGVVLDGRSGNGVVLRGKTRVGKGAYLKDVFAEDTIFEGDETLDGFGFYPPRFDKVTE